MKKCNYKNLKEELANLETDEVLFLDEKGEHKYVILDIDMYKDYTTVVDMVNGDSEHLPILKLGSPVNVEVSYDEYERIKKQIDEAIDKTFKPNPERFN